MTQCVQHMHLYLYLAYIMQAVEGTSSRKRLGLFIVNL